MFLSLLSAWQVVSVMWEVPSTRRVKRRLDSVAVGGMLLAVNAQSTMAHLYLFLEWLKSLMFFNKNVFLWSGQPPATIFPPCTSWSLRWRMVPRQMPDQYALGSTPKNSQNSAGEVMPYCRPLRFASWHQHIWFENHSTALFYGLSATVLILRVSFLSPLWCHEKSFCFCFLHQ